MDTELLVDNRVEAGRKLLAELLRDGFDVDVAFWATTRDEGLQHLYIGSPSVDPERIGQAYPQVYACLSRIPDAGINLSEIKLVSAANPVAQDAMAVRNRYGGRLPARYRGERLGNLSIQEAYIYPDPAAPMTRQDVLRAVATLMDRAGPLQPSTITLKDGSRLQAIPTGVERKTAGTVSITFRDVTTGAERIVSADQVANIH